VRRLHESRIRAIIRGIQRTASDLGLKTLAEYVEHERQANVLREIGVDWGQGHYFGEARLDETESTTRRHLNVNWQRGAQTAR
jgi:EAL domain-containing protein (putative c-di-GMP-specific phosphodiesterase class I)